MLYNRRKFQNHCPSRAHDFCSRIAINILTTTSTSDSSCSLSRKYNLKEPYLADAMVTVSKLVSDNVISCLPHQIHLCRVTLHFNQCLTCECELHHVHSQYAFAFAQVDVLLKQLYRIVVIVLIKADRSDPGSDDRVTTSSRWRSPRIKSISTTFSRVF